MQDNLSLSDVSIITKQASLMYSEMDDFLMCKSLELFVWDALGHLENAELVSTLIRHFYLLCVIHVHITL